MEAGGQDEAGKGSEAGGGAKGVEAGGAEAGGAADSSESGGAESGGSTAGNGLHGLQIFEFNAKTAPTARHKRIKDFQGGGGDGAKVFIVTYRTAAVGITLTAANRVYLFEPALDPAQEVQAAGRIHRLGQTKEVLIKRFCFRNSIEEAVIDLHAKIKDGSVMLTDGRFPKEAVELFRKHGVEQPHVCVPAEDGEYVDKTIRVRNTYPHSFDKVSCYGCKVQEAPCRRCTQVLEQPGTKTWWGKGIYKYMNGKTTDSEPQQPPNFSYSLLPGNCLDSDEEELDEDDKKELKHLETTLDAKPVPVMNLAPVASSGCGGAAASSSSATNVEVMDLTGDD